MSLKCRYEEDCKGGLGWSLGFLSVGVGEFSRRGWRESEIRGGTSLTHTVEKVCSFDWFSLRRVNVLSSPWAYIAQQTTWCITDIQWVLTEQKETSVGGASRPAHAVSPYCPRKASILLEKSISPPAMLWKLQWRQDCPLSLSSFLWFECDLFPLTHMWRLNSFMQW